MVSPFLKLFWPDGQVLRKNFWNYTHMGKERLVSQHFQQKEK